MSSSSGVRRSSSSASGSGNKGPTERTSENTRSTKSEETRTQETKPSQKDGGARQAQPAVEKDSGAQRTRQEQSEVQREQTAEQRRGEATQRSQQQQKEAQREAAERAAVANSPQMRAYNGESSYEIPKVNPAQSKPSGAGAAGPAAPIDPNAPRSRTGAYVDRVGLNDAQSESLSANPIPGPSSDPNYRTNPAYQSMVATLQADKNNGVSEIRTPIYVNAETGKMSLGGKDVEASAYEGFFAAAQEAGMKVSVALIPNGDSVGANPALDEARSSNYANAARDLATMAAKYGVKDFELGNEPNAPDRWPSVGSIEKDAARYMTYEKKAYQALKGALPGVTGPDGKPVTDSNVVMAGLSHTAPEFLDQLYKNGLKGNTDAINLHPYDLGASPADLRNNLERVRAVMLENGEDPDKKMWLTELGANTENSKEKSDYIRMALGNMPEYVEKAFLFNKIDTAETEIDPKTGAPVISRYGLNDSEEAWRALRETSAADNARTPGYKVDPALAYTYSRYAPALGEPVGKPENNNGVITQNFKHGSVTFDGQNYDVQSDLGRPTGSSYQGDHSIMTFENGQVSYYHEGTKKGLYEVTRNGTGTTSTGVPNDPFAEARSTPGLGNARGATFYEPNGNLKQVFENGYLLFGGNGVETVIHPPAAR